MSALPWALSALRKWRRCRPFALPFGCSGCTIQPSKLKVCIGAESYSVCVYVWRGVCVCGGICVCGCCMNITFPSLHVISSPDLPSLPQTQYFFLTPRTSSSSDPPAHTSSYIPPPPHTQYLVFTTPTTTSPDPPAQFCTGREDDCQKRAHKCSKSI